VPRVKDSQFIDRSRLAPRPEGGLHAQAPAMVPPPTEGGQSTLMQSSMPTIASGSDHYARQFYGMGNVPRFRIFPVTL
jgi:hypothetical protein